MAQYILLGATKYDFSNDNGERVSGVKITYSDRPLVTDDAIGLSAITENAPIELWESLKNHPMPAIADIDFRFKAGKNGKTAVVLENLKVIKSIDILSMLDGKVASVK